ncbi:MAG: 7-carboxy-7-deazaguanine synthase QueE [Acidobacteria bacterium]|nr:7-carboxy-7-deazaguanine synthase QueE [Acidobacteriota bacterium]
MTKYYVNEIFLSVQGEGLRAGTLNVFVRFAGCNLTCRAESEGFDCDTNFSGGRPLTLTQLMFDMSEISAGCCINVILTGGEPALQIDLGLISSLKRVGWYVAIETNGTRELPAGIDWVCVSPKTAEHTLRVKTANEVKYVLHRGQALPKPAIEAPNYLISPAVQPEGNILREDTEWCLKLLKENPTWRLSVQTHKFLHLR